MRISIDIAQTGAAAVVRNPLRSAATVACVLAVLVPYLAGIGVSQGVQREAEASVRFGADLYVSGSQFGRPAAVPLSLVPSLQQIDGVTKVTPRIVGHITIGGEQLPAVLVGMPAQEIPATVRCVQGRLFGDGKTPELVVGRQLARRLRVKTGDRIPPFYRSSQGDHVSTIVGVFEADAPLWEADLIFTSLQTASKIFDQPGWATELLVHCRPGYEAAVRRQILRAVSIPTPASGRNLPLRIVTRQDLAAGTVAGFLHRDGIFNLHFLLAFAVGMVAVLVTSGLGLSERRREIGILKATGWQTDEVLFRCLVENLLLSALAASLAILIVFIWLRVLNGYFVASVFLEGVSVRPEFPIPFLLTPIPALLSFVLAFVLVMSGSIYATWRAAVAPPRLTMRS